LNWFGAFRESRGLEITVEVNVPYQGREGGIAGFFARESTSGLVYLMHSGRVGGGMKGVGKTAWLSWSDRQPVEVFDADGGIHEGLPVMPVEGATATQSAIRYVADVARFKAAVRSGLLATAEFKRKQRALQDFYAEARGRRRGRRKAAIDYVSRHGEVVDALNSWRQLRSFPVGARIRKNVLIDLSVAVGSDIVEIYEVKMSTLRSDLYAAIGQVMVHGEGVDCQRVLVLPHDESIPRDVEACLRRLGIGVVRFVLNKRNAEILQ